MIQQIFYNSAERRVRSFWRVLITGVACFLLATMAVGVVQLVFRRPLWVLLAGSPLMVGVVWGALLISGRWLDRRSPSDFGLRWSGQWAVDLAFGLMLGLGLVSLVVLIEYGAGWIGEAGAALPPEATRPLGAGEPRWLELVTLVVLFVCVGIYEELAFRGYLLRNLAEGWNIQPLGSRGAALAAALATSLLFGVVHGVNPHATSISVGNTILSGFLLSAGLLLTGQLAIPIGFHITWNMTQSLLFGLPVSGVFFGGGLWRLEPSGPAWLTGGEYGIEGGLLCTAALGLGLLLIVGWVRLTGQPIAVDSRFAEAPTLRDRHEQGWTPMNADDHEQGWTRMNADEHEQG